MSWALGRTYFFLFLFWGWSKKKGRAQTLKNTCFLNVIFGLLPLLWIDTTEKWWGQLYANDVCWTRSTHISTGLLGHDFQDIRFSSSTQWKRVCEFWNVKRIAVSLTLWDELCKTNYFNMSTVFLDYISSWKELNTALQTENAKFKSWQSWVSVWSAVCCVIKCMWRAGMYVKYSVVWLNADLGHSSSLSVDTWDAGNWVTQLHPLARHDGTCRPNFFPLSAQFLLSRGAVSDGPVWSLASGFPR